MPQNVKYFEKLLAKSDSGFFVDELSWADIFVDFEVFEGLAQVGDKKDLILENAPLLKALDEKVKSHSKIAEWLEKRPITSF